MKTVLIIIFAFLLAGVLAGTTSCGHAPRQLTLSTPHNKVIEGDWKVDSVTADSNFTRADLDKLVLFDDVAPLCYEGGMLELGEDGAGWYTVTANGCIKGRRIIIWNMLHAKNTRFIVFLRENAPKGVLTARYTNYTVQIESLDPYRMLLSYPVLYKNTAANIYIKLHKEKMKIK